MGELIRLSDFGKKHLAGNGFRSWRLAFQQEFTAKTSLADFSDSTLACLVRSSSDAENLIYDLIMGILDLGPMETFQDLKRVDKIKVLDVSIFLLDQFRFECMRRLKWIAGFPGECYPVFELVASYEEIQNTYRGTIPRVLETNPEFRSFQELQADEREGFVRKQILSAIELFLK